MPQSQSYLVQQSPIVPKKKRFYMIFFFFFFLAICIFCKITNFTQNPKNEHHVTTVYNSLIQGENVYI